MLLVGGRVAGARVLDEHLQARPDLLAAAASARINISGCPNGCGQPHIAAFGFQEASDAWAGGRWMARGSRVL